jgi:hypothetical protein
MFAVRSALAVVIAVVLTQPVPAAALQATQAQELVLPVAALGPHWLRLVGASQVQGRIDTGVPGIGCWSPTVNTPTSV